MTILFNQGAEFDEDPALEAWDRAQPVGVAPTDGFVVLRQRDGADPDVMHCILIERRDLLVFVEALARC